MGILSSLNTSISGLNAMGSGMGVVSDNIANASTIGFKSSRAEFQDVLAMALKGIDGGDQIGAGTKLAHITPLFSQGNISRTDQVTDLALNGNGFFEVEAPFGKGYTRDGTFHFNKNGQLINGDEYKVTGYQADETGKITNKLGPIKLGNTTIPAKATDETSFSMNLDSRADIQPFNILDAENTSDYNTSITVYDNVGTARLITMYINKTQENNWQYHILADGKDALGGIEGTPVEMANGTLVFNNKGQLQQEIQGLNSFNFNKGAKPNQQINFDFGTSVFEGGDGTQASTQYGSKSNVARNSQNGASAATLSSLSFNDNGILTAVYNNGQARDIAQISIAKFENNEGLFKVGKNLFKESRRSGEVAIGKAHEGGRGEVLSKSIELSNVDLASEFVNLMTTQRNFTANAKAVTTSDEMLQEVLNLKR